MVSVAVPAARQRVFADRAQWRIGLWLALELVAVSFTLIGLLDGAQWWFALVGAGAGVLIVDAVLRTLGVPNWLAPLGGALTAFAILTAQYGGGTAIGVLPTPATFAHFGDLLEQAARSVAQQSTPATVVPELMFLVVAGGGIFAVAADVFATALRMPALTAVPIAAVLVVPSAFLITGVSPLALTTAAIAYLGLLRADVLERRGAARESGLALSIAASTIVLALLVSTTAPGFQQIGRQGISAGGLTIGTGVNPLIDLGQDLRRPAGVEVMRYTTTSPNPPYLRLASLDTYSGTTWRHTASKTTPLGAAGEVPMAPGLDPLVATSAVTTQVRIENMQSGWLPVPYAPAKITGPGAGDWGWESVDRTITTGGGGTGGVSYTARSKLIQPTAAQLREAASAYPAPVAKDLFVPFNAPVVIARTAREATAGATTDYDKAVALQNYFHDGSFSYSLDAPVRKNYDGDSMDVIATFLKLKEGYCVHFASAMAVMARTLGIPARIAMGYLPGTFSGSAGNGRATYSVSSDDLHAWPELYFSGVGWVAFEPTVGRGTQPSYTVPGYVAPPPEESSAPSSAATTAAAVPTDPAAPGRSTTSAAQTSLAPIFSAVATLLFVLLLLAAPAVLRRWRRTTRFRRLSDDWGSAMLAWTELVDTARDLGMSVPPTQTARAFAHSLRARWDDAPATAEAVESLLAAAEREQFGRPGAVVYDPTRADDLRVVLARMLLDAGPWLRLRATLMPVSLLPRFASPSRGRVRFSA